MTHSRVTMIGRGPSYSRKTSDLFIDQYRFAKTAGYFSSLELISLLPTHHLRSNTPTSDSTSEFVQAKSSIWAHTMDNGILCKIQTVKELSKMSALKTKRILRNMNEPPSVNFILGSKSKKNGTIVDTKKTYDEEIDSARNCKIDQEKTSHCVKTCRTISSKSKDSPNRYSHQEQEQDKYYTRSSSFELIRDSNEIASKSLLKDSATSFQEEKIVKRNADTPSEEEIRRLMQQLLNNHSQDSLNPSSESCVSGITPSSQWSFSADLNGSQKTRTDKSNKATTWPESTESKGTQTEVLYTRPAPVPVSSPVISGLSRHNMCELTSSLETIETSRSTCRSNQNYYWLSFVNYDAHTLYNNLNHIWKLDLKLKSLPKVPNVLSPLSTKFVLDTETGNPILLKEDSYSHSYFGQIKYSNGTVTDVVVKLYFKDTIHWNCVLKECCLLMLLKGTGTVSSFHGLTCVEENGLYWPLAVVCDSVGVKREQKPSLKTLADFLQNANMQAERKLMTKTDWIQFCINLVEKLFIVHQKHAILVLLTPDNILMQKEGKKWRPYFTGLINSVYDQHKNVLELEAQLIPKISLNLLKYSQLSVHKDVFLERARALDTKSLGLVFEAIAKRVRIRFGGLIRRCKSYNDTSRPTLPVILEALAKIGKKYETHISQR